MRKKIEELIEERMKFLEEISSNAAANLKNSPEGWLRIAGKKGMPEFYLSKPGQKDVYISRHKKIFIESLAQASYDREILKICDEELKMLQRFLKRYKPDKIMECYGKLHPVRKALVQPHVQTDEEFVREWEAVEVPVFNYPGADRETCAGHFVRSKSEEIISDALYHAGVPHRYEQEIILNGYGAARPDFVCLNKRTREIFIWEHFGKMDDQDYFLKTMRKLEAYHASGYYEGKNFIFTTEVTGRSLNSKRVRALIEKYLV